MIDARRALKPPRRGEAWRFFLVGLLVIAAAAVLAVDAAGQVLS